MNLKNKKRSEKEVRQQAKNILQFYSISELEDTLFDVFEEANLHSDYTYQEKEKRKFLHETLRSIMRTMDRRKKIKQIK